ncbi:MAG: TetR/AcrR family transcriptional regulator [Erythrobacter sp.]|nr:TetR/AcrR family transcriptional regulator [Erythrobacter sp.]
MRAASFDRAEVIGKITDTFWENGFEATSIQVLEAATGLKRQSLYNAFGNKDAMFELALDHYDSIVSQRLLATLEQDDPGIALRDFFTAQAAILLDADKPSGCLVAGGQQELANRDAVLGRRMGGLIDQQHDGLVAAFERWQAAGRLAKEADPSTLAAIVMTQVRGQAVLGRSGRGVELVRRASHEVPKLFERYFA